MKTKIINFILVWMMIILTNGMAISAEKVFEYGFEDWGGSIADTPLYPFGSTYGEYCEDHEAATEVVAEYNGINPHSGNHFWLLNHGPGMENPPSGITTWDANAHNLIGLGSGISSNSACGRNPFDIDTIETGEVFIRFWVVNSDWSAVATDHDAKLKFLRYYEADEVDMMWMVYQNVSDDRRPQFGLDGPGSAYISGTIPRFDDGQWHKCSMYVNYNTGFSALWFDVNEETLSNATLSHNYGTNGIPGGPTPSPIVLIGNWSANNPTENVYHAIDDIEIWDGLPSGDSDDNTSYNVVGLRYVSIRTPSSTGSFNSNSSTIDLSGIIGGSFTDSFTASWNNSLGGSGSGTITSSNGWEINGVGLATGTNIITVTVTDSNDRTASASIEVTH